MRYRAAAFTVLGLALVAAVKFGCEPAIRAAAPDAVLAKRYGKVLGDTDASWSKPNPNVWLSGLGIGPSESGRPLAIGDVITISGKGGAPVTIEVSSIDQVDATAIGLPGVRVQLVTGRDPFKPRSKPVRLLFSAGVMTDHIAPKLPVGPDIGSRREL